MNKMKQTVGYAAVSPVSVSDEDAFYASKVKSYGALIWGRFIRHKLALTGFAVLLFLVVVAILAPVICRYDPTEIHLDALRLGGLPGLPSKEFWFGTDKLGRDYFARIIYGMRTSLAVGFGSTLLAFMVGVPIGCVAGYYGGAVDWVISRGLELTSAVPSIFLMIFFSALLGGGVSGTILVIGLTTCQSHVKCVRAYFFSLREQDTAQAARAVGMRSSRIMFRHILPFSLAPEIVSVTQRIAGNLVAEVGMSFLGFGVREPTPSWGTMLNASREFMISAPILALIPSILIALIAFSCNFIGDGLRDAFDPKIRT